MLHDRNGFVLEQSCSKERYITETLSPQVSSFITMFVSTKYCIWVETFRNKKGGAVTPCPLSLHGPKPTCGDFCGY